MSAPFRRPNASDTSSYIDDFEVIKHENTVGATGARTLKPPPEIWELVHPVPVQEFKPSQALVSRLATTNVLMVTIGIVLMSGICVAGWKFHVPQKVAAVFAEPDTPLKKTAPATLKRTTTVETAKSESTSVTPAATVTTDSAATPSAGSNVNDVAQPTVAVKRVVRRPAKPVDRDIPTPAVEASGAAVSTAATVRPTVVPKAKEPAATTAPSANATGTKVANSATENPSAKPKATTGSTPEGTTPAKTNVPAKPKVIQWP